MIYVVWFIVALALLVVELASITFYALFLRPGPRRRHGAHRHDVTAATA